MALVSMAAHRLRAFLTMLGIIIGIAAVSSVVALGNASQRKVLSDIASLGTNTIEVFPGKDFGDARAGKIKTLVLDDARALDRQNFIAGVTPTVSTSTTVRYRGNESNVLVNGVGESYFQVKGAKLAKGRLFDTDAVRNIERQAVIDDNTRKTFFADDQTAGIGRVIWLGKVPCRIVGVIAQQQGGLRLEPEPVGLPPLHHRAGPVHGRPRASQHPAPDQRRDLDRAGAGRGDDAADAAAQHQGFRHSQHRRYPPHHHEHDADPGRSWWRQSPSSRWSSAGSA